MLYDGRAWLRCEELSAGSPPVQACDQAASPAPRRAPHPIHPEPAGMSSTTRPRWSPRTKRRCASTWSSSWPSCGPNCTSSARRKTASQALRLLDELSPTVVFLDIEMPGATGLEVARQASGRSHVVFVTAYDQHAVAAFDQGAIDYVLKPRVGGAAVHRDRPGQAAPRSERPAGPARRPWPWGALRPAHGHDAWRAARCAGSMPRSGRR